MKLIWWLLIAFMLYLLIFLMWYSEPYVTEDELKLMLRGAELSGAIEEEEQVQIIISAFVILNCYCNSIDMLDFFTFWELCNNIFKKSIGSSPRSSKLFGGDQILLPFSFFLSFLFFLKMIKILLLKTRNRIEPRKWFPDPLKNPEKVFIVLLINGWPGWYVKITPSIIQVVPATALKDLHTV